MLDLNTIARRRSHASSLSLSPTGWNPSRATISPASVSAFPQSSTSPGSSDSEGEAPLATLRRKTSPRSLSPPPSSFTAPLAHQICAFPSWPTRDSLTPPPPMSMVSPTGSYFGYAGSLPSSRISDEDLEDLDFSAPSASSGFDSEDDEALAAPAISWSNVGTNAIEPVVVVEAPVRRRLPPPPAKYLKRRSSSRGPSGRAKGSKKLGAIAE